MIKGKNLKNELEFKSESKTKNSITDNNEKVKSKIENKTDKKDKNEDIYHETNIRCLNMNVRGYYSKREKICEIITKLNCHIVVITETHFRSIKRTPKIDGYKMFLLIMHNFICQDKFTIE